MSGWRVLRAIVLLPGAMTVLVPALILCATHGRRRGDPTRRVTSLT